MQLIGPWVFVDENYSVWQIVCMTNSLSLHIGNLETDLFLQTEKVVLRL